MELPLCENWELVSWFIDFWNFHEIAKLADFKSQFRDTSQAAVLHQGVKCETKFQTYGTFSSLSVFVGLRHSEDQQPSA